MRPSPQWTVLCYSFFPAPNIANRGLGLVDFDPQLADGAAPGVELLLHYRAHLFGCRAGSFEGLVVELGAHIRPAQDEVGLARQALDDFLRRPGRRDEG